MRKPDLLFRPHLCARIILLLAHFWKNITEPLKCNLNAGELEKVTRRLLICYEAFLLPFFLVGLHEKKNSHEVLTSVFFSEYCMQYQRKGYENL